MIVWALVAIWIASVVVAIVLGRRKGRRGALYGIFLSWVGVVVLALLPARGTHESTAGEPWDETFAPTDDAFFKNMQYYSRQ